jgi:hypothetical protein
MKKIILILLINFKYMKQKFTTTSLALLLISLFITISCNNESGKTNHQGINPNMFSGSDFQKIQAAVDAARGTTNKIIIPPANSNGTNIWLLDSAILLPGDMTVILDNCTLQLSDQCRDNMFRSENVGIGITDPQWLRNISIIGVGDVLLKGADNPRATGDGNRTLVPAKQPGRVSYGSDAGKEGIKQKGDWRNIMILMAYVDGFKLKNVNIKGAHAWAVSFERTLNAEISDITFDCPEHQVVNGKEVFIANRDGIDLRHGCKNFRINNISGTTGDDFIALSILGLNAENKEGGTVNSTMVTSKHWRGPEDDTENVVISNISCNALTRGVAIRANSTAGIRNVFINGLIWEGRYNAILAGGKGYGDPSIPGRINNIHAMNITGNGRSLIQIEEAIANSCFMNGIYRDTGEQMVIYNIDKNALRNVIFENFVHIRPE